MRKMVLGNSVFYIDGSYITAEGCKHLTKSHWKELEGLFLCIKCITQDDNKVKELGCARLASS